MRGSIHPLSQYTFIAWCSVKITGTNLPFFYLCRWLVCRMFKEALSNWDKINRNGLERRWLWPTLKRFPGIRARYLPNGVCSAALFGSVKHGLYIDNRDLR
jgi:hypothetical protein